MADLQRMRNRLLLYFFLLLITNVAKAQTGLCPSNLDFEMGDFTGWECRAGTVFDNPLPLTGPIPGRHTIISASNAGFDPFGFFPTLCPNGSNYSVKLGNQQPGSQSESISYTYAIPSTLTTFSMLFHYAVVLENPANHPLQNQPRFQARIIDVSSGTPLPCVNFDFISSTTPGGFRTSPIPGNGGSIVLYKDWTPVSINLSAYIGRTIKLEFITKDCAQNGHAGYAYLDVNTNCNGVISGNFLCPGDNTNSITLTAPYGFDTYEWYSDPSFTQIIGTSQTLILSPPPTVGSIFPVIVNPFPGYGCKDTLYATITVAPRPIADAGPDLNLCKNQSAQIGSSPLPGYTYAWTPAGQVSDATVSNPTAWLTTPVPTEFIVKATDILTGCASFDTTVLLIKTIDTAIRVSGKDKYCVGDPSPAVLSVNNASTSIQWYESATQIPGATSSIYQPPVSGNYWAEISQQGCIDSTAKIPIIVDPLPQASFYPDADTGCVSKNSILFTNTSTVSNNSPMNYLWKFSDGTTQQTQDATISFSNVGAYTAELVAITAAGCKDSTSHSVRVFPNAVPDFLWDSICTNRPVLFRNLSIENSSPSVKYEWDFKNGGPVSTLKDPLPVSYTTPGTLNVTLKATAVGCENDPKTISRTIQVNKAATGIRYREITVPLGSSQYIHVRGDIGKIYDWKPHIQLSRYNEQYTEFFAASDDVKYLIDITDQHTCVTVDTMQMLVLKKPGYYLPTAFTPNGDGLNDVVKPYLIGMKSLKSFSIFNRWGDRMFYSVTYGEGWDGKFKGTDQGPGVYVWILVFVDSNDKIVTEKGTLTLIR